MPDAGLPHRLTASEVCQLAGYGKVTLGRRIRDGKMPEPVDRGRENLFDRRAVFKALGIPMEKDEHEGQEDDDPWGKAANAIAQRKAAALHGSQDTK